MPRQRTPIYDLPSGKKLIRYRGPDGKQYKETFATRREARARLEEVKTDMRRGRFIDPAAGEERFSTFAMRWSKGRDWKETTRETWPLVLARLEPELGGLSLASIDRLVLEAAQMSLAERYARRTVVLTMSYAKAVMSAAYHTGRIGRDPTSGLGTPKARAGEPDGQVRPEDVPTRAEVLGILGAAPPRFRAAIALAAIGCRVGEVLAVSGDRVDLERRRLVIDRQLQRIGNQLTFTSPKREKVRTVALPQAVALELRRHLRDYQGGGLLFRGERGAMLRRDAFYNAAWRPALVSAGLAPDRFVFHSLRHFAASSMLAEGAPITAVAGHLGDTVETVQRTYAHWLRDDAEVPAIVLDRVFASAPELDVEGSGA